MFFMIGRKAFFFLSKFFYVASLTGIAVLLVSDIRHHLALNLLHQRLDAWPLVAAGLSYICLQFASRLSASDRVKGVFLGIAFLLWGGEQLLPSSRLVTVMDEGAVTIFVIDITSIVWARLSEPSQL
jgi:hypothetical protein